MSSLVLYQRPFTNCLHQLRQLGAGVVVAIATAVCGGALWHHVLAQEPTSRLDSAEKASEKAAPAALRRAPELANDLASFKAKPEETPASHFYEKAASPGGPVNREEILIVGDPFRLAPPNSWLEQPLSVRAKPGRPVTFVALDSGTFENGKTTITVQADETGLAVARFHVTNQGYYRVLASSPENVGPARFSIRCLTKELREDIVSGRYAKQYLAKEQAAEAQRRQAAAEVADRIRRQAVK